MDWIQLLFLFFANASLIVWFRTESRNDYRHLDAKIESNHRECRQLIETIHEEMKDFHARLCVIEENRKGK